MAAIRHKGRLLLRLRRVIESWPEDSSRSGRDLGGHLKEVLLPKYESRAAEVRLDRREQCSWLAKSRKRLTTLSNAGHWSVLLNQDKHPLMQWLDSVHFERTGMRRAAHQCISIWACDTRSMSITFFLLSNWLNVAWISCFRCRKRLWQV